MNRVQKLLLPVLAGLFLAIPARATTVTGTVYDSTGTAVSGAAISFRLINIGRGNVARNSGTSIVAPALVTVTSGSDGTFSVTLVGNDQITPAGTLYEVVMRGPGFTYGPFDYSITGSSADLNSLTPEATYPNTSSQVAVTQLVPPSGCAGGQVLEWNGTAWVCAAAAGGSALDVKTNGADNASQSTLNFLTSSTNAIGLTLTPTYQSGGGETFEITGSNYSGNAATATALAAAPTQCSGGQFATGIAASGNANCSTPAGGSPGGSGGQVQINNAGAFGGAANLTYDSTTGSTTLISRDKGGQVFNVKAYGAKGDGVFLYACSTTSGNTTVTCTDASFTAADVGKAFEVDNTAGSAPDVTTIASVTDATHVVVTVAPTFTKNPTNVVYGTDDTTAIQNLINTVFAAGGGTLFFPKGVYLLEGALGGPESNNAILYIPQNDFSTVTPVPYVTLSFQGTGMPSNAFPEPGLGGKSISTTSSAVLYGMTYGAGTGKILGGPGGTPWYAGTVVIRDLTFRTRPNPDLTPIALYHVKNAIIKGVTVDVNLADTTTVPQPTNSGIVGITLPTQLNGGLTNETDAYIFGYYTGTQINEHGTLTNVFIQNCITGVQAQNSTSGHAVYFHNLLIQECKTNVSLSGAAFGTVDVEDTGTGWYSITADLTQSGTGASVLYFNKYPNTPLVLGSTNANTVVYQLNASGVGWVHGLIPALTYTFATLPTATGHSGVTVYCSDCKNVGTDGATFDSAAASGGTGTNLLDENGAWRVH